MGKRFVILMFLLLPVLSFAQSDEPISLTATSTQTSPIIGQKFTVSISVVNSPAPVKSAVEKEKRPHIVAGPGRPGETCVSLIDEDGDPRHPPASGRCFNNADCGLANAELRAKEINQNL